MGFIAYTTRGPIYRWWLSSEGTSRNVPIAGFEMILREDYKSWDEVEGLIIFPKYHFKPQDTRNILWCSRQQSRHLLYYRAPHCPAGLLHKILIEIIEIHTVQRGFSCAQCNAYLVYCVRNKQPARSQGRWTYIFETIVSQAHFAICLREKFSQSEKILWYRSMYLLRSPGEGKPTELCFNHVTVFSQSVTRIRLSHITLMDVHQGKTCLFYGLFYSPWAKVNPRIWPSPSLWIPAFVQTEQCSLSFLHFSCLYCKPFLLILNKHLKGKFSSGIEGAPASTLNCDFNWKQLSEMILWIFSFDAFKVFF